MYRKCGILEVMATVTRDKNLEFLIEQKIIELYGDPDEGLELKKSFVTELRKRLKKKQKFVPLADVLKTYGLR